MKELSIKTQKNINIKNEKGSITLYTIISILFFLIIVSGLYINSSYKVQKQNKEIQKIQKSYEKTDINTVYEEALSNYDYPLLKDEVEVTYYANGGSGEPDMQTQEKNKPLTLSITVPTREGYHFLGWSTDKSSTSAQYQPGETLNLDSSIILYAVWEKHDFSNNTGICTICTYDARIAGTTTLNINWNFSSMVAQDTGFDLAIGSGTFVPGFEEGLIGAKVGETVTIDVTFPETYSQNPDLAGQLTQFVVTINSIKVPVTIDMLNDEQVAEYFGDTYEITTVQGLSDYATGYVEEQAVTSCIIEYMLTNSTVDVPEN